MIEVQRIITKRAIVISLDELRDLMREFITEHGVSPDELLDWTFEIFLQ